MIHPVTPEITYETEVVKEDVVNFDTVERDTDELPLGENRVIQEGVDGYTNVTYKITLHDGEEVSREESKREVVDPVDEIIENGTFEEEDPEE